MDEVEEWNEFGELKETIGPVPANNAVPAGGVQGINTLPPPLPVKPTATQGTTKITQPSVDRAAAPVLDETNRVALPGAAEVAARNKVKSPANPVDENAAPESMTSAPADKQASINAAKQIMKDHPALDHLSAPASAVQSGTATPQPEQAEPAAQSAEELGVAAEEKQHRGSEVKDLPREEIKKVETDNTVVEEDDTTKGASDLKIDESEKTQDQEAKEPEDAAKSVKD